MRSALGQRAKRLAREPEDRQKNVAHGSSFWAPGMLIARGGNKKAAGRACTRPPGKRRQAGRTTQPILPLHLLDGLQPQHTEAFVSISNECAPGAGRPCYNLSRFQASRGPPLASLLGAA